MIDQTVQPRPRIVLLGASNLTRAFPTVLDTVRQRFGPAMDVYAALGHGRSYGMRSSVLFGARALPGILECGLWEAIETSKHPNVETSKASVDSEVSACRRFDFSTFALITDIGNDVLYGVTPEKITNWVEQCIDRLEAIGAEVAMTMLPIETLRTVTSWQFRIVKSVMFPTHSLTYRQAMERADELHMRITQLGARRKIACAAPCADWYGFDPIHIRRRHWRTAWGEYFKFQSPLYESDSNVSGESVSCNGEISIRDWLRLRTSSPQRWWLWGRECGRKQPAAVLSDGSRVLFF